MKDSLINERIRSIIDDRFNGNVSRFCRETAIKQSTISTLLGPRQSKPSFEVIQSMANASALFDLSLRWLITGVGEMYIDGEELPESDDALIRALLDTIREQQKKIDSLLERLEAMEEVMKKEHIA